ncbi:MAG TPA: threonine synthase [Woeseiaceae bacterium]
MKFISTRSGTSVSLDQAIISGIAPDGGLYIPDTLPQFTLRDFQHADSITDVARILLEPFFEGSRLQSDIDEILAETFSFPIPLRSLPADGGALQMLELFHGPTAAFKDVGARFLAACLGRLEGHADNPLTILVATSGDTGGAVAAAIDGRPGMQVVVLYPEGRISERQAQQLTCWSDNVLSLAVNGAFDDCQALVKKALDDPELNVRYRFSSANSINVGRLLPQCTYYAWAGLAHFVKTDRRPGFIVPTGNLGNGLACLLAKSIGLPIGDVIFATNANRLVADYLAGAEWLPKASEQTLASAMDVGNPSNMERLMRLYGEREQLAELVRAVPVFDDEITTEIRRCYQQYEVAICPHTATAMHVYRSLEDRKRRTTDWIVVATAHPAKFEQIVEPIIGATVPLPETLSEILARSSRFTRIEASLSALQDAMEAHRCLDDTGRAGDK